MRARLVAVVLALSIVGAAFGQSLTLGNLKGPVAKACKVAEAKSIAELWKQLATCNQAVPVPTPPASPLSGVLDEGDSISAFWAGNHTGIYAAAHPGVPFYGRAVGGSGLDTMTGRFGADVLLRPAKVTILIGGSDVSSIGFDWFPYKSSQTYLDALFAYAAKWRATGAKVYIGTILGQCQPGNPNGINDLVNAKRQPVNAGIRAAVDTKIDGVIDYAADPVIGTDAAACDKALFQDGVHPTDGGTGKGGQDRLAAIYTAAIDGGAMPMPTPSVPAPSLSGVDPVASGLKVADLVQSTWGTGDIPGPEAPGVQGAFRFLCAPGQLNYDDPILYPGQPGKSHLHLWFGNTLGNAGSTYASLRSTGDSTCNSMGNRSAYWMPGMMHPTGKVVQPSYIFVYYKRAPANSIYCKPPYAKACLALPRGLRYVFGYNMLDPKSTPTDTNNRWFNCDAPGVGGHYATIREAAANCPVGARIGALVVSPNCWNGKDLDSPDHRSHMAYQHYDGTHAAPVCPSTHPYLLPFFEPGAWFVNDGTAAQWRLSCDMAGDEGGKCLHGDWFGAWEDSILDLWTANCIDKALSCSGGDLGNGTQLKTLKGYSYSNAIALVDPPAKQ
jgi:hypothetical protein